MVLGYFYQCDLPDGISEHRTTIFRSIFGHIWESLLIRGWAVVLAVLDLFGFAVMAYRSRERLITSLLVMGLTFLVTGCWIRLVNQETAHLLGWLLPLIGLVLTFVVNFVSKETGEER